MARATWKPDPPQAACDGFWRASSPSCWPLRLSGRRRSYLRALDNAPVAESVSLFFCGRS